MASPWASLAGSAIGGLFSYFGAKSQNKSNRQIAQSQMDFQREMSDTSYQRSMADMRKAGLNPILAYKQGGASTPAGAGIPAVNELEGAASSAKAAAMQVASMKNINADTQMKISQGHLLQAQDSLTSSNMAKLNQETQILRQNLSSAKAAAAAAKTEEKFWSTDLGKFLKKLDLAGTAVNPFTSAAGKVKRLGN